MGREELTANLLYKLYRKGIWGGRHTPIDNLFHIVGDLYIKESKKIAKELNNLGWVLIKKSTGEEHISLNPHRKGEIRNFILSILKIDPEMLK